MKNVFQVFIDSIYDASDAPALLRAVETVSTAFDLVNFAYLIAPHDAHEIKLISNYPGKWTSHYISSGYERSDPVINMVRRMADPFEWGDGIWSEPLISGEAQLMDEAAEFGIRCGFTFPIHDRSCRFASVTFAADQSPQSFRRCFAKHRQVLQLIAFLFHVEARKTVLPTRLIGSVTLSPRELECLEWAAEGKSAWDIGQIIGVSRRTAAFHLDNAKMKLGVRTIPQAVAMLVSAKRHKG